MTRNQPSSRAATLANWAPPEAWIVDGFVPAAAACTVVGGGDGDVSTLAVDLGLHIAAGAEWNGRTVERASVLILDTPASVAAHADRWRAGHPEPVELSAYVHLGGEPWGVGRGQDRRIIRYVREHNIAVVVLPMAVGAGRIGNPIERARAVANATGAAVLLDAAWTRAAGARGHVPADARIYRKCDWETTRRLHRERRGRGGAWSVHVVSRRTCCQTIAEHITYNAPGVAVDSPLTERESGEQSHVENPRPYEREEAARSEAILRVEEDAARDREHAAMRARWEAQEAERAARRTTSPTTP